MKQQKAKKITSNQNQLNQKLNAAGFSLTEILVTITIVGALAVVAGSVYSKARDAPFKAGQKLELSELSKALHFARQVDGGYHQKIFAMGYRPSKFLLAGAGLKYQKTDPVCCTGKDFPQNAQEASAKASKFFTLHKDIYDSNKVESSVKANQICQLSKFCTYKASRMRFSTGGINFGSNSPIQDTECNVVNLRGSSKCTCNTFLISSRVPTLGNRWSIRAFMNEEGFFCRQDVNRLGGAGGYKLY